MTSTKSLLLCTASGILLAAVTTLAVLTPATEANKTPMALLIVGTVFGASPALLVAAARADEL